MSNKRDLEASTFDSPPVQKSSHSKNKKVKFVADVGPSRSFGEDGGDDDLQYDELNPVGKVGKRRVKNEGYDSDSSTENAEVREKKSKTEDEDMFDADDGPSESVLKKSKKRFDKVDVGMRLKQGADAKEYLDLGDIEGQEFGREEEDDDDETGGKSKNAKAQAEKNGDDENECSDGYSDEEEDFVPGDEFANADDAPRARRKSKKGMGFMLSKFNMAEELTEGRMAADGSYVASVKDPEAAHDNWLEGVDSKKTMKLAREAKRKQEEEIQKALRDQQTLQRTRKDCYVSLLSFLSAQNGRTVSQTLYQLGSDKRTHQQTRKKKVTKRTVIDELVPASITDEIDIDKGKGKERSTQSDKSEEQIAFDQKIAEITDLASTLMGTHGELDVYDMSHGTITGLLKSEGLVPRDWIPPNRKPLIARPTTTLQPNNPSSSLFYKFKPDPSNPSSLAMPPQIYGPFDRPTMESWAAQGFFGPNANRIDIKVDYFTIWTESMVYLVSNLSMS
ncbi:hypothetical protein DFH28DRAFT_973155 [Melampsora americana]|nr:hypothetical protein DFH28DRAFT_973155 [Melampsora americana]